MAFRSSWWCSYVLVLAIVGALLLPQFAAAQGMPTVTIVPLKSQIAVNEEVIIEVRVENVIDPVELEVVNIALKYSDTLLQTSSNDITPGSFFTPSSVTKEVQGGTIVYDAQGTQGAGTGGVLFTIKFRGISAGPATIEALSPESVFLGFVDGAGHSPPVQGVQITVGGTGPTLTHTPTATPSHTPTPTSSATPITPGPAATTLTPSATPTTPTPSATPTKTPSPTTPAPVPTTLTPTPSSTPITPQPICTLPACPAGQVLYCPGTCTNGCGVTCATPTPIVTLTPTPVTPQPMCTPPACAAGQVLHCPGTCPNGCGVVCVTPVPIVTLTPTPSAGDIGVHVVRQNETLFCLGRAYEVSPWAIARRNNLLSPNYVYPGQRLVIPNERWNNIPTGLVCVRQFAPPTSAPGQPTAPAPATPVPVSPCRLNYTVRYADTLWSIARRWGGSPWTIATVNNIANPNLILIGETLCIP